MAVTARSLKNYQVEIQAGNHQFISDEPLGVGDDAGAAPFDLLLGALASCTIITLHMYANRKNWPLEKVEVALSFSSLNVPLAAGPAAAVAAGSSAPNNGHNRSSVIESHLTFYGPLTTEQMQRLEEIASRCPVHRMLTGDVQIRSTVSNLER